MMSSKQFRLLLVLVIVSGFVGGAVSSWFFAEKATLAHAVPVVEEVLVAQEFRLKDENGVIRGRMRCGADGEVGIIFLPDAASRFRAVLGAPTEGNGISYLSFFDPSNNERVRLEHGAKGLRWVFYDAKRNPIWAKP